MADHAAQSAMELNPTPQRLELCNVWWECGMLRPWRPLRAENPSCHFIPASQPLWATAWAETLLSAEVKSNPLTQTSRYLRLCHRLTLTCHPAAAQKVATRGSIYLKPSCYFIFKEFLEGVKDWSYTSFQELSFFPNYCLGKYWHQNPLAWWRAAVWPKGAIVAHMPWQVSSYKIASESFLEPLSCISHTERSGVHGRPQVWELKHLSSMRNQYRGSWIKDSECRGIFC